MRGDEKMIWRINGADVAKPANYSVSIMDLDGSAERNLLGLLLRDRVATKRKIAVEYKGLSQRECQNALEAISNEFFTLTYNDPWKGENTITCYVGDRTAEPAPTGDCAIKYDVIE